MTQGRLGRAVVHRNSANRLPSPRREGGREPRTGGNCRIRNCTCMLQAIAWRPGPFQDVSAAVRLKTGDRPWQSFDTSQLQ